MEKKERMEYPPSESTLDDKSVAVEREEDENEFDDEDLEFIAMSEFKSMSRDDADEFVVKVESLETFTTEYSICTKVSRKIGSGWNPSILPLKSNASRNSGLLRRWEKGIKTGRLVEGTIVKILTWLATSKNGKPIRRFRIVYL